MYFVAESKLKSTHPDFCSSEIDPKLLFFCFLDHPVCK